MILFDVIIIGSGPAGMAAAYELQDRKVLMLDIGNLPPKVSSFDKNLYDLKEERDLFSELIGDEFESLHNIDHKYLSPKLKAPLMRFVTKDSEKLAPLESNEFEPAQSFAFGGLANAWGAGMLRFNDYDLKGFPIKSEDLNPFYDKLNDIIGISGEHDDLSKFFGYEEKFQPPHALSLLGNELLSKYNEHRSFFNRNGIYIGKNRLGLLTEEKDGRSKCNYDNLEFYKPNIPSIYNPTYTIQRLVDQKKIKYEPHLIVKTYAEIDGGVEVIAENIKNQTIQKFKARFLVLAAGCINTAKIVLNSYKDYETKLPILDNPISYIPFLVPKYIGNPIEKMQYSAQLVIVYDDPESNQRLNGSFYGIGGPLKSDLFFEFPLSIKGNFASVKYLIPAIAIMQLFYSDKKSLENYLQLKSDEKVRITYKQISFTKLKIENHLINVFRRFGYFSHKLLCKFPAPGNSFHYAGCLPMSNSPKKYEVNKDGLLFLTKSVYVADSANFSAFPAKNHSYTIMANSMRIASRLRMRMI